MKLIQPSSIEISSQLPSSFEEGQVYYLGYGRNAWQSTWINRYYPNSLSMSEDELKLAAEKSRVQGSVFKIVSLPAIGIIYPQNAFLICSINERSTYEYQALLKIIKNDKRQNFWRYLPDSTSNWLIVMALGTQRNFGEKYHPKTIRSHSNGSRYYLGWSDQASSNYSNFISFGRELYGSFQCCAL